jgi:hypothetical protein
MMNRILFNTCKSAENVWIGLKYENNRYQWIDNTKMVYQNWSDGYPKNRSYYCTQISVDKNIIGKWSEELCNKKNIVVCQKLPELTLKQMQKMFIELKYQLESSENTEKQLNSTIIDLRNKLNNTETRLTNAEKQLSIYEYIIKNLRYYQLFVDSNHNQKILFYALKSKNSAVTQNDAVFICKENNATLIEIESFMNQIHNQTSTHYYWLNAFRDSSGQFNWISGHDFDYQNWAQGNPSLR